jgi:hypothetical protein
MNQRQVRHAKVATNLRRVMKMATAIAVVAAVIAPARSQSSSPQDSPEATVRRLFEMALDGDLLTPEGWKKAGALFAKPSSPTDDSVEVISEDYSISRWPEETGPAVVYVGYFDYGKIDARLRYSSSDSRIKKWATIYHLVRVDPGVASDGTRVATEAPVGNGWKIEEAQGRAWTGVRSATTYVTEKRDLTADPTIRKNANETLAILAKLGK